MESKVVALEVQISEVRFLPHDLPGLPCSECGGTSLRRFPWTMGYALQWIRHVYCEDCTAFLVEVYDREDGEYWIMKHQTEGWDIE